MVNLITEHHLAQLKLCRNPQYPGLATRNIAIRFGFIPNSICISRNILLPLTLPNVPFLSLANRIDPFSLLTLILNSFSAK